MELEIHTFDNFLVYDLMESDSVEASVSTINIEEDSTLTYNGEYLRKAVDFPRILMFTLTIGGEIAVGVFVNWLYDKLKEKKVEKIIINRREVHVDKGEITKIIEESIEKTREG